MFQPASPPVHFQSQCAFISIINDSVLESDTEDFSVYLKSTEPQKVLVGVQQASVTITDDEG